jgi:hypothetical protein
LQSARFVCILILVAVQPAITALEVALQGEQLDSGRAARGKGCEHECQRELDFLEKTGTLHVKTNMRSIVWERQQVPLSPRIHAAHTPGRAAARRE